MWSVAISDLEFPPMKPSLKSISRFAAASACYPQRVCQALTALRVMSGDGSPLDGFPCPTVRPLP